MYKILIVEDDEKIAGILEGTFRKVWLSVI